MSITEDLDLWWAQVDAYNDANAAKAKFQDLMSEIDRNLDELSAMNAAGKFDKLPASWKAKALWAWQTLDTARDTVKADAEFMEGINWRP